MENVANWPSEGIENIEKCPVCTSKERTMLYDNLADRLYGAPDKWQLFVCNICGSAYLDQRPTEETIIELAYKNYFTHTEPEYSVCQNQKTLSKPRSWANFRQSLRNGYLNARYSTNLFPASNLGRLLLPIIPPLRERADRYVRHLPPPFNGARLLEIGCGNGNFLLKMRQLGWEVYGIEPDIKAAKIASKNNIPVITSTLNDETLPEQSFDAITLHHVIEHLHKPINMLEICYKLLRPLGLISIITPNFASRGSKIYGRDWYPLDPPRHLVLFTTRSLFNAISRVGFKKVTAHASFFDSASIFRASEKLRSDSFKREEKLAYINKITDYFNPYSIEEAIVTGLKLT